jgi:hypothetical protein
MKLITRNLDLLIFALSILLLLSLGLAALGLAAWAAEKT